MLASVEGLSAREAGIRLGVGKTTITDARAKRVKGESPPPPQARAASIADSGDGSLIIESTDEVPQTRDDITARMRSRGFDPEQYTFSYRFSEWEAQVAGGRVKTMYSARASAVEKKVKPGGATVSYDDLVSVIENHQPIPATDRGSDLDFATNTFIFNFADPQIGKVDINGGTRATIERFMNSLDHACALLDAEPATEIVWADLGDGIENFCNTSSQRATNDLNLVEQVRILRRLQVVGLTRLAQFAPVTHISVPSNHSQNRVGFQQPASTAHDDWGLEVQVQLEEAFTMAGEGHTAYPVTFRAPDAHLESVSHTTADGTRLGLVHGHRSNSQNNLEQWWAGQSLGRQPTWDADILLVGHFHNWAVRSVGSERYIITTPSLDGGSSWFTVARGNVSTAGVLGMRVANKRITFQQIL
jgi:hypothetical protein